MSKDATTAKLAPTARSSAELQPVLAAGQQELAAAKTLPDVLPVIHLAAAVASAAERAAKLAGVRGAAPDVARAANEIVREAAVLRIEAQARAGELLREMAERGERERRGGDRAKSHDATLPALGVTKSESSRWQRLAGVPADVRQAYAEEARGNDAEVTIAGLLRVAAAASEAEERRARPGYPTAEEVRARSREIYRDVLHATDLPRYDAWMVAGALDGRERRQLDAAVEKLGAWLSELRKALSSYDSIREGK
ncbi:MAG: hypothetical protein E6J41_32900 [Chloroflexi bacterium]|nr:MAG: hypothetical protein E6J41_32900 [Chloroflexota bacterium]